MPAVPKNRKTAGLALLVLSVLAGAPVAALLGTAVSQCLGSIIFAVPFYYVSRFLNRVV